MDPANTTPTSADTDTDTDTDAATRYPLRTTVSVVVAAMLAAAALLMATTVLTACSTSTSAFEFAAAPRPASADVVPFGSDNSFQWTNSIGASVLSAAVFTPSPEAVGLAPGDLAVRVMVKVTNGTSDQFDVSGTTVHMRSGADGIQDNAITDRENGISAGLDGDVAPGRSASAVYAFAVPRSDLSLLDVEVTPDFNYDTAIFEGAAG
jgi:hypothetical protein